MSTFTREQASDKLQAYIANGRNKSQRVVQSLMDEANARVDVMIPAKQGVMQFLVRPNNLALMVPQTKAVQKFGKGELGFTEWSQGQALMSMGVPQRFISSLQSDGVVGTMIAEELLNSLLYRIGSGQDNRRLLRVVNNTIRGWLSPTYGILDQAELIGGFAAAVKQHSDRGIVFTDGVLSDRRYAITAMWPSLFEPWPGEIVIVGASLQSSDYGFGAVDIKQHVMRLVCLNGAMGTPFMRKIHRGTGYGDNDESFIISERTKQLSSAATVSLITDALNAALSAGSAEKVIAAYRKAANKEVNVAQEVKMLQQKGILSKEDGEKIPLLLDMELEVLPTTENRNSALRFGQLLSYMANSAEGDKVLQLQESAGMFYLPDSPGRSVVEIEA